MLARGRLAIRSPLSVRRGLSRPKETKRAATGGLDLDSFEAGGACERAEALGVFGTTAQAEKAEDMTDAMARRRAEIKRDETPIRLEDPERFGEAAPLEIGREVVEHEARQHDIEVIVRRGDGFDTGYLKTRSALRAGRFARRQPDHLRRWIDSEGLPRRSNRLRRGKRQSARPASSIEDPIAGNDGRPLEKATVQRADLPAR